MLRVTNYMMINRSLRNISNNTSKLDDLNNKLATGKNFRAPSDDPVGVVMSMKYKAKLGEMTQFQRNIDVGTNWLEASDMTLDRVITKVTRVKELTIQSISSAMNQQNLDAIAYEVDEILNEMATEANSLLGEKFLFGGYTTLDEPFEFLKGGETGTADDNILTVDGDTRFNMLKNRIIDVRYVGDEGKHMREINQQVQMDTNVNGSELFFTEQSAINSTIDYNPKISYGTALSLLNSGEGVKPGKFEVQDRAGNSGLIDLTRVGRKDIDSVKELVDNVNNQFRKQGLNLEMDLNTGRNGFFIEDFTSPPYKSDLLIKKFGSDPVVRDLGIYGTATGTQNTITGRDLDVSLSAFTTIDELEISDNIQMPLGVIHVSNGNIIGDIDLSEANTIGDIVDIINKSDLFLESELNAAGNGIRIQSTLENISGEIKEIEAIPATITADTKIDLSDLEAEEAKITAVGAMDLSLLGGPVDYLDIGGFKVPIEQADEFRAVGEYDLSDGILVEGDATKEFSIVKDLRLATLNSGKGIPSGKFNITDRSGTTTTIDLTNIGDTSLDTVSELVTEINNQLAAGANNAVIQRNATSSGFNINDTVGGAGNLIIFPSTPDTGTALNLGIEGSIAADTFTGSILTANGALGNGLTQNITFSSNINGLAEVGVKYGASYATEVDANPAIGGSSTAKIKGFTDLTGGLRTGPESLQLIIGGENRAGATAAQLTGNPPVSTFLTEDVNMKINGVEFNFYSANPVLKNPAYSNIDGNYIELDGIPNPNADIVTVRNNTTGAVIPLDATNGYTYDTSTNRIYLHGISGLLADQTHQIEVNFETGQKVVDLINAKQELTDVTATLGAGGEISLQRRQGGQYNFINIEDKSANLLGQLGLPSGKVTSAASTVANIMNADTNLSSLNNGQGITPGVFAVTDMAGTKSIVDLTNLGSLSLDSVGEVVAEINNQLAAEGNNAIIQLNATNTGFDIVDGAGGATDLLIEEASLPVAVTGVSVAALDAAGLGTPLVLDFDIGTVNFNLPAGSRGTDIAAAVNAQTVATGVRAVWNEPNDTLTFEDTTGADKNSFEITDNTTGFFEVMTGVKPGKYETSMVGLSGTAVNFGINGTVLANAGGGTYNGINVVGGGVLENGGPALAGEVTTVTFNAETDYTAAEILATINNTPGFSDFGVASLDPEDGTLVIESTDGGIITRGRGEQLFIATKDDKENFTALDLLGIQSISPGTAYIAPNPATGNPGSPATLGGSFVITGTDDGDSVQQKIEAALTGAGSTATVGFENGHLVIDGQIAAESDSITITNGIGNGTVLLGIKTGNYSGQDVDDIDDLKTKIVKYTNNRYAVRGNGTAASPAELFSLDKGSDININISNNSSTMLSALGGFPNPADQVDTGKSAEKIFFLSNTDNAEEGVNIVLTKNDTLDTIIDKINSKQAATNIIASASSENKLVLTYNEVGSGGTITFSDIPGGESGGVEALGFVRNGLVDNYHRVANGMDGAKGDESWGVVLKITDKAGTSASDLGLKGESSGKDLFSALVDLRNKLFAGDVKSIQESTLSEIITNEDHIVSYRSIVGAKVNRLERTSESLKDTETHLTELLSATEDLDMAEAIMNLSMLENVHRASLSMSARIIQPTLMDFLR